MIRRRQARIGLALALIATNGRYEVRALPTLTCNGVANRKLSTCTSSTPPAIYMRYRPVTTGDMLIGLRGGDVSSMRGSIDSAASSFPPDLLSIVSYFVAAALATMTVALVRKVPRSGGRAPDSVTNMLPLPEKVSMGLFHLAYFVHALIVIRVMPERVKDIVFSPGGVIALGTLFPIVETINAVCTDIDTDNKTWLMYWIMHGAFSYTTEFVDSLVERFPRVFGHWYEFEFYMLLWLILPMSDGASVCYEFFTNPVLVPMLRPMKEKCEGWLTTLALAIVNASHLWFVGVFFMALPTVLKRAAVMIVGTTYPVLGSIVSIADDEGTQWLTYWSCFSLLFLSMICIEKYVGHVPGLYTGCLACIIYLMLPIFNGSEAVFRNILVPLFRQREALIVMDARQLAKTLAKQLPPDRHEAAQQAAAAAFMEEANKSSKKSVS